MSLLTTIHDDQTRALKERRADELSILRLLQAALKNRQIELMHDVNEEEVRAIIRFQIKQLKDALETFRTGNRLDLVEKTEQEVAVLERYLPVPLADEELSAIVREALSAAGAVLRADMGKGMGSAMRAVAGRAEGARVKAIVESILSV